MLNLLRCDVSPSRFVCRRHCPPATNDAIPPPVQPLLTLSASVQTVSFAEHSKFYARRNNMSSSPSVSSSATRACTSAAVLMSLLLALAVNHQVGAAAVGTTIVADTTVVTDATSTADVGSSNDSAVVAASTAGSTLDTTDLTDTADNVLQPAGYGLAPPKQPQPPPVSIQNI